MYYLESSIWNGQALGETESIVFDKPVKRKGNAGRFRGSNNKETRWTNCSVEQRDSPGRSLVRSQSAKILLDLCNTN